MPSSLASNLFFFIENVTKCVPTPGGDAKLEVFNSFREIPMFPTLLHNIAKLRMGTPKGL